MAVAHAEFHPTRKYSQRPASLEMQISADMPLIDRIEERLRYMCEVVIPLVLLIPPEEVAKISETFPDKPLGFPPYRQD